MALQLLSMDVSWQIGSNSEMSIWEDNWIGQGSLFSIITILENLSHIRTARSRILYPMAYFLSHSSLKFKNLIEETGVDLAQVTVPAIDCPDEVIWEGAVDGILIVK